MRRLVSYPKYGTSRCLRASPLSKRRISVRSFSARERSRRSLITRRSSHLLWSLTSKERVDSTTASTRTIKKLMISISISVNPPPKTRRNRMQPTKRARTRIRRFGARFRASVRAPSSPGSAWKRSTTTDRPWWTSPAYSSRTSPSSDPSTASTPVGVGLRTFGRSAMR